jgi:hypothetical protein
MEDTDERGVTSGNHGMEKTVLRQCVLMEMSMHDDHCNALELTLLARTAPCCICVCGYMLTTEQDYGAPNLVGMIASGQNQAQHPLLVHNGSSTDGLSSVSCFLAQKLSHTHLLPANIRNFFSMECH